MTNHLRKAILAFSFFPISFCAYAQEYLYGLTQTGGYYDMGVAYQITTSGTDFIAYGSFDGKNGGNAGNNSGFIQLVYQGQLLNNLSALTMAGDQNLNHGMRIDISPGQGGLLQPFNFQFSESNTGFNPGGKFLQASDGLLYGLTSTKGQYNGGSIFSKSSLAGPYPTTVIPFDGVNTGRSPKGSLVQGPSGLIFGMTEFGGTNDQGVIFSYHVVSGQYKKIHDFAGTATGANPTSSLVYASDGKLYGMTRAGGTSNDGVIFRINTDGTGFTKLVDLDASSGTAPLGSLIQHADGILYGMTSTGGSNGLGTIFSLAINGTFTKLHDFNGINGKSPLGDLVSSTDGQTMYGVTFSGGANDKGIFFKLENGNQFTPLYDFDQSTGSNPVGSLLMKRSFPVMTFADMSETTTTSAAFAPDVQVPSGLPVYLVSHDPSVAVIENDKIKPVGPGGVYISAYVAGNHQYLPRTITKLVNVIKSDQTIDFPPITAKTYGDGSFTMNAASSSGLPVRITTSSNDIVSSDGTNWFINNAGTITIYAIQDGNSIYNEARVSRELVVNRKDQTITFNSSGTRSCCQTFGVNATSSGGLDVKFKTSDAAKLFISNNSAAIYGLGDVQVTAYNDGNRNYLPAERSNTITIIKGIQSISTSLPFTVTYRFGQSDIYVGASSTSGLPVTFISNPPGIAVMEGSFLRLIGVGTTTITATQNGNDLINAAFPLTHTVTVEPPVTPGTGNVISFSALSTRAVSDAPFNLTAKSTSGLPVSYSSSNPAIAEITGNLVTIKSQGFTTITATQAGDATTPAASPVQQTLTVEKLFQNISLNSSDYFSFGVSPIQLPSRSTANLLLTYQTNNASIAYVDANYLMHIVSSGNVRITASQAGNSAFNSASANYNITIYPLNQTVTFAPLSAKTFGDEPFSLFATSSSGLPIEYTSSNPQVATVNGSTVTIVGAGTTTIKAKQNGYPGYSNSEVDRVLTVNKASQAVTFAPLPEKKFSDNAFTLSANSSVNLPITFSSSNPAIASITGSTVTIHGAGTVTIVALQAGNENYLPVDFSQPLNITDGGKTFDLVGAAAFGGQNNSGVVFAMKTDGSSFTSLKTFEPRTLPFPQNGFIKGSDGRIYGNFQYGGTTNAGAIVRLEADGSDMTIIYNYNSQTGGTPTGNILQASNGDLFGTTRSGGNGGGTIFKVKPDGSDFITLHELNNANDGYGPVGGVTEASNGKLYGMTGTAGFFNYGSIFSINKDGSNFNVIFRFNDNDPIKSGYSPQGELVQGTDGYLYGSLSSGGDQTKGVVFKILPDGSNFTKIVVFDGSTKGSNPNASLLIGSNGKVYGVTSTGGAHNQGCIYVVDNDGANFARLVDFNGTAIGAFPRCKLTEGSDGLLYGMTTSGGTNDLGTIFKIGKDGAGFQKMADFNSSAATPLYGPLVEAQPGKFIGMTSSGGASGGARIGGAIFSITSGGLLTIIEDFPQVESLPITLIADPLGEFHYGIAFEGKPGLFSISPTGQYNLLFEFPSGVSAQKLLYASTGHLWCVGVKDNLSYVFRIKPDGSEFEPLAGINDNVPLSRLVEWINERPDGTIFGITSRGTVNDPGIIFSIQNDGTGFASLGLMPNGIEFSRSCYLQTADGDLYAVSLYTRELYQYQSSLNAMKKLVTLPAAIDQIPMKLIELNGGRIGVAMIGGYVFSVNKDGSQFATIMQKNEGLGTNLQDMLQTYDGWIYISANMGGEHNKGVIYKVLADGSSYQAIHSFNGSDGGGPNNIIFKKLFQTFTFDPLDPKKITDPAFTPVASSSSGGRITFTSSNSAIAKIEDGKIKPVGVGTAIITASISGNANYYAVADIQQELVIEKGVQTISFTNPGDKVVGMVPFDLVASTQAGLDITFLPLSDNIALSEKTVTIVGAGVARIKATQSGNATYLPADPVETSFCINPPKPSIVQSGAVLTSSNLEGNQWYRNSEVINGAFGTSLTTEEPGTYTVISTVEGCASVLSDPHTLTLVITEVNEENEFVVKTFPNPTKDIIQIQVNGNKDKDFTVELLDTFGRVVGVQNSNDSQIMVDVTNYTKGLYFIKVITAKGTVLQKIVKE
jgi:uncharacterized repeat protein (TIGR03803 family)